MESLFLLTAIVGAVEFIKALNSADKVTAEIIAVAALIGGITGAFSVDHLTIVTGIQLGLSAVGVYTTGQVIGGTK